MKYRCRAGHEEGVAEFINDKGSRINKLMLFTPLRRNPEHPSSDPRRVYSASLTFHVDSVPSYTRIAGTYA